MLFLEYERDWGPEPEYKASHFTGRTLLTGETAGLIKGLCFCRSYWTTSCALGDLRGTSAEFITGGVEEGRKQNWTRSSANNRDYADSPLLGEQW